MDGGGGGDVGEFWGGVSSAFAMKVKAERVHK